MHAYNTDITWDKLDSLTDSLPSTQQSKWKGYAAAAAHPSMKAALWSYSTKSSSSVQPLGILSLTS